MNGPKKSFQICSKNNFILCESDNKMNDDDILYNL